MAKIQLSRVFDVALVATTKAYQELQPFVEFFNQLSDNVVRTLTNGISLLDNVDCKQIKLDMKDDIPTALAVDKRVPLAVYLSRQIPSTPMVTAFSWEITNDGAISLRVKFDTPPPTNTTINCSFIVHYS